MEAGLVEIVSVGWGTIGRKRGNFIPFGAESETGLGGTFCLKRAKDSAELFFFPLNGLAAGVGEKGRAR
jgi:hypothetical protein